MTAEHKRSGVRHLIHPDGLATLCGKTIYRANFRRTPARMRTRDCQRCMRCRMAAAR